MHLHTERYRQVERVAREAAVLRFRWESPVWIRTAFVKWKGDATVRQSFYGE